MTLKHYIKRYELVTQGKYPANRKKAMLASLKSEMEAAFNMPMQSNLEWEQQNGEVMELYRKVSATRDF